MTLLLKGKGTLLLAKREPLQDVGLLLHDYLNEQYERLIGYSNTLRLEVNVALVLEVPFGYICCYCVCFVGIFDLNCDDGL